jgi:hypothetical protein
VTVKKEYQAAVWTCGEEDSVNSRRESGCAQNGAAESPAGEDPDPLTTYHNWKKKISAFKFTTHEYFGMVNWKNIYFVFKESTFLITCLQDNELVWGAWSGRQSKNCINI